MTPKKLGLDIGTLSCHSHSSNEEILCTKSEMLRRLQTTDDLRHCILSNTHRHLQHAVHKQYLIQVPNLNASKQITCTGFWMNLRKHHTTSLWKYSLTVELLIIKHQRQNISVSVTLICAVSGPEVTFADRTTLLPIRHARPCSC